MSAILSAEDLNDFITPGVACIKPVETLPKVENSNPYEVTTEDTVQAENPAPASISLTDCLACSGCVTSAEAVLVSLQSHSEVLNTLDSHPSFRPQTQNQQNGTSHSHSTQPKLFVASVSPQVRASIAATFGISERRAGNMITQFLSGSEGLRKGGTHNSAFSYVLDTNRLREACLVLGADEVSASLGDDAKPRPILTSACPGWICYAEKTHPHVLPHLSALKSPQALSGTLLKSVLSKAFGILPSDIWHLAIMPCFDKKLEASREELTDRWWSDSSASKTPVRDVDCVITSKELLTLAEARNIRLASLPQTPIPRSQRNPFPDHKLSKFLFPAHSKPVASSQSIDAGSSGGYLHHILRTHQNLHPGSTINTTQGRNADVVEYTLTDPSNPTQPLLKCARYYGFRNIQNLVRKLKPARQSRLPGAAPITSRRLAGANNRSQRNTDAGVEYTYVEVMACPGGCTNGGGQIKVEEVATTIPTTRGEEIPLENLKLPQTQREWLARVDEAYFSASTDDDAGDEVEVEVEVEGVNNVNGHDERQRSRPTEDDNNTVDGINTSTIHEILDHWSDLVNVPLERLVYTTFRRVESDVGKKKGLGDTERIAAIAGMSGGGW